MDWRTRQHLNAINRTIAESNEHFAKMRACVARDRRDIETMRLTLDEMYRSLKETKID